MITRLSSFLQSKCSCSLHMHVLSLETPFASWQIGKWSRQWLWLIHILYWPIWLLTLLFSLQYLRESCFGNDDKFLLPNPWVVLFFHLPNLLLKKIELIMNSELRFLILVNFIFSVYSNRYMCMKDVFIPFFQSDLLNCFELDLTSVTKNCTFTTIFSNNFAVCRIFLRRDAKTDTLQPQWLQLTRVKSYPRANGPGRGY
jgi:hypothetical protein